MEPEAIARRIRTARTWADFSQDELADLLDVSASTLGRWERGEKLPKMPTLFYLAEVCGVKRNWFTDPHAALEPLEDESLDAAISDVEREAVREHASERDRAASGGRTSG